MQYESYLELTTLCTSTDIAQTQSDSYCMTHLVKISLKVSPPGQKVILTVRDSDEKWWKSWCGFFTQESKRHAIGDINLGVILNKASEHGYMGPKFQVMYEVGRLVCSRYLRSEYISPGNPMYILKSIVNGLYRSLASIDYSVKNLYQIL